MTHSELIFQQIPEEMRNQFIEHFYVLVTNLFEDATLHLDANEKKRLLTATSQAWDEGDRHAMFEAFEMVVTSYFQAKRKANEEWLSNP